MLKTISAWPRAKSLSVQYALAIVLINKLLRLGIWSYLSAFLVVTIFINNLLLKRTGDKMIKAHTIN